MKPFLLEKAAQESSFLVSNHKYSHFLDKWHYHPELELCFIQKSTGIRFIGDNIEKFQPNEIVLLGKNIPHRWLNDPAYFEEGSKLIAEATVIHFKEDFLGEDFFSLPEMGNISLLLERAKRGIVFLDEKITKKTKKLLLNLRGLHGMEKIQCMLQVLHLLSGVQNFKLLSSDGFAESFQQKGNRKLDKVYAYILKNFQDDVSQKEAATIANMSASAFSRFFKKHNNKTFVTYLLQVRIGFACKLLMENQKSVSAICYESGFRSMSNFNKQFKQITGINPTDYRKKHMLSVGS